MSLKKWGNAMAGGFKPSSFKSIENFQGASRRVATMGADDGGMRQEGDMPVPVPVEQKAITGTVDSGNASRRKKTGIQDTILAGRIQKALSNTNASKNKLGSSQ